MANYYLISAKNSTNLASAFTPEADLSTAEVISKLGNDLELNSEFKLIKLTADKNGLKKSTDLSGLKEIWLDYQPNNLAWPFFSERLKESVQRLLTDKEGISWIKIKINGNEEERKYYIPFFTKKLDVLDEEKTTYVKGTSYIIKPHFSLIKVTNYTIFHTPFGQNQWQITPEIYITEQLKFEIQKNGLTGVVFEKTRVS